jgi:hypothetical protein
MGKQPKQPPIAAARPFDSPEWSFLMACAWVAFRTRAAVEAAAGGEITIRRAAVERLLRELRAGRLTAWGRVDGKAFAIAPHRWRGLEPVFERKRFLPAFIESFGRLMVTVRDGMEKEVQDVTISREALQQIFSPDAPGIGTPDRGRARPRRERARLGLTGRFGNQVPSVAELDNGTLYKQVTDWLAANHPVPRGSPEISKDTLLRAAGWKP